MLPRLGVQIFLLTLEPLQAGKPRDLEGCSLLWLESPVNPTLRLVSIPCRMSHRGVDPTDRAAVGIPDSMIRLSVGLESAEALIEELEQALDSGR